MIGPEEERHHDMTLLRKHGFNDQLENFLSVNVVQYYNTIYIYFDDACVLFLWFQVGYDRSTATAVQKSCNTKMSSVREAV